MFGGPAGTRDLARRMGVDAIGIMSRDGCRRLQTGQGNVCVSKALDGFPDSYWGLATFDYLV